MENVKTALCFEAHAADGLVWSVWHRGNWHGPFRYVRVDGPLRTVYRGDIVEGPECPRAYLEAVYPTELIVSGDSAALQSL